ncbi:MAG: type II toxin-antitoxin system RelE/ParE family toxin [Caulobacteraceae bacterium]
MAKDAPRRALSFVRELRARAMALGRTPLACPLVAGFEARGVRRRVHGNYLILYRLEAGRLDILRILHAARDYASLLESSNPSL